MVELARWAEETASEIVVDPEAVADARATLYEWWQRIKTAQWRR